MKSILIHAWVIHKKDDNEYFLPYTHWIYLNEIFKYYQKVLLLSPTHWINNSEEKGLISLGEFEGLVILELPPINGYIDAVKYFFQYRKKYQEITHVDAAYTRYPVPFGWLQKIYLKNSRRIIHFVGDPVDAAKNNPNFSWYKKLVLSFFFKPEHRLYIWACKGADVYTNGFHIAAKLKKFSIDALPLVSSTLNNNDFFFDYKKEINPEEPKLLYLGYLRTAKGVEIIIDAFELLQRDFPKATLSIVGSGENEGNLQRMIDRKKLKGVTFFGLIGEREILNSMLRNHDIFCFGSLSEGSPRVILEAMANGLNVISTPVGSLPMIFNQNKEIIFFEFNRSDLLYKEIIDLLKDDAKAFQLRLNAYNRVKNLTINNFIKNIFDA